MKGGVTVEGPQPLRILCEKPKSEGYYGKSEGLEKGPYFQPPMVVETS